MDIHQIIFSDCDEMCKIKVILNEIAKTDIMVLITGEVGTEKELFAQFIHLNSPWENKSFFKLDYSLISKEALSSRPLEFRRGDSSGGFFQIMEEARSSEIGTIFVKDIEEFDASIQAKLLQLLESRRFYFFNSQTGMHRVGLIGPRLILTFRDQLGKSVNGGYFNGGPLSKNHFVSVTVPPLRDRKTQIISLSQYYLNFYKERYGRDISPFSSKAMDVFREYDWPGNIAELERMIKQMVILDDEGTVLQSLSSSRLDGGVGLGFYENSSINSPMEKNSFTLKEVRKKAAQAAEVEIIQSTLQETRWNRKRAAKLLGIGYNALIYKMRKYNLK